MCSRIVCVAQLLALGIEPSGQSVTSNTSVAAAAKGGPKAAAVGSSAYADELRAMGLDLDDLSTK